jgi:hypothetical protein
MRTLITFISVLTISAAAMAAPSATTQPATRPTWGSDSTGRQRRWGSDNNRESGGFTSATSRPNGPDLSSSAPMPDDFAVLNLRNIFFKGHLPSPDAGQQGSSSFEVHSVETTYIFNGVTITDGKPVAFLENTDSGAVMQAHVGDTIARGKIVNIALDSLDYQANGRVTRVQIGQNLAGGNGWGTTATSEPSSTGSASTDAMLEKLRQKRLQELGGK